MVGGQRSLLEDSLARLDAALGSPGGGVMRTPRPHRRPNPTGSRVGLDVISMVGEAPPTSAPPANNTLFDLSVMDSPSMVYDYEDVTGLAPHTMLEPTMDVTSAALLADDDPGVRASQVLFSEFINIMVGHPSEAQVWQELEQYQLVCAGQVDALAKLLLKAPRHHANFTRTQQVYQQLLSERNTWRLLGSLYMERLGEDEDEDKEMTTLDDQPTTDLTIVTKLYDTSRTIREAQLVIDWLEKNAADDSDKKFFDHVEYFGDNHIGWENTLKALKSESSGAMPFRGTRALVTSADPDAPVRQGRPLHDLDHEDEQRLMRCVFAHVRGGQVAAAQELCIKTGHHWRAATLEGWKLHHDPNPANPALRDPVQGNPYRDVWKAVAWRAASDERLPQHERAVYGALCGHLQAMLGVCRNWQDVVWAYTRCLVDQWVEEQLRAASTHLRALHPLPKDYPEEKLSMAGVFSAVEQRPEVQQEQRHNPYHVIQKHLILDDVEALLRDAHVWLADGLSPHLLRCLTHLVLFLRKIGRISQQQEALCTDILEACVKESIERGDVEQVAWYTSVLPVWLQVDWYARFLHNVTDDHHRRHALNMAATVGLDTGAITTAVVTNIRLSSGVGAGGDMVSETTVEDRVKISAIDWLLYDPKQRIEALRQANALMRSFLISRKIGTTKMLFKKIPSDSVNVILAEHEADTGSREMALADDNVVREYLCVRTFLDAQDSFTDWFDHYHQKRPTAPKKPAQGSNFSQQVAHEQQQQQHQAEMDRWNHTLKLISKTACERLYNVLLFPEGGWMVDVGEDESDSFKDATQDAAHHDRTHQMSVLRSIYIPQVTSLLQNILQSTDSLKEAIMLADLIASEQHQLYKAFGTAELQRFLTKLQETSRELLDHNCDALGYPLN